MCHCSRPNPKNTVSLFISWPAHWKGFNSSVNLQYSLSRCIHLKWLKTAWHHKQQTLTWKWHQIVFAAGDSEVPFVRWSAHVVSSAVILSKPSSIRKDSYSLSRKVPVTHTHTHIYILVSIYSKWASWFWSILWLMARWQCYPWKDPYCPVAHFSVPYFHPHTSVFLQPSIFLPRARVPDSESFWACSSAFKQCVRSRQRCVSTSSSAVISAGHTEGNSDGNWYSSSSGTYINKILQDFSQMSCLKEQSTQKWKFTHPQAI